jgi:hypothetical protein
VVTLNLRNAYPQFSSAGGRTITNIKGNDLFRCDIKRNPDPLLVPFGNDETPHFIGLRIESQQLNAAARLTDLDVEIIRRLRINLGDEIEQPG